MNQKIVICGIIAVIALSALCSMVAVDSDAGLTWGDGAVHPAYMDEPDEEYTDQDVTHALADRPTNATDEIPVAEIAISGVLIAAAVIAIAGNLWLSRRAQ